ncbi:hypothetical protein [Geothrix fuzhouensis]|uniref:hypothetical protein n=1 Tax=Geothrix fuzhouensis TaxID=2966451 RepID=UPI002147E334|nr:hypothetical protein [Geothrix fuzhouensis]
MPSPLTLILVASVMAGFSSNTMATTPPQAAAPAPHPTGAQMPKGEDLTGKVLERLEASPYCYLRLKTAKGEVWTAVPEAKAEKGSEVTVANAVLMTDFESKTLKRTFAEVYFGTLATAGAATPAAGANPHAQGTQPAKVVKVGKVAKAPGAEARTVSEIWAQKDSLKGKSVTLRGKVVKYSKGILGKNWLHLQDGSGDKKKGTNDITVTSQDEAAAGDTVTIRGTVQTSRDFGAGYSYAVIIEDAKVIKK